MSSTTKKFTCRFCKEQFDVPKGLYKHLQSVHNAGVSRDNRTCPICGVLCSKYESYRDHLLYIHGQTDDGQKLTFKSLNEFLVWKAELELKHNCKYVLQTSPKVLPNKEKKYFYQCDRSDSKSKDKKSSVVMKTCSSLISVVEGTGVFKVEYWDTHSGHNEPSAAMIQSELEAAISSVELVNTIADSGDSLDKNEELLMPEDSDSTILNVEKPTIITKTNSPSSLNKGNSSPVANTTQKIKTLQSFGKFDGSKKKTTNSSVLHSLASVACGKGISRKPKLNESKNGNAEFHSREPTPKKTEKRNDSSLSTSDKNKDNQESVSADKSASKESKVTVKNMSTILLTNKTTPSVPPAIAPKITSVTGSAINSLFTTNNTFPNQLVIVNPAGMNQNSLSSAQNIFSTGQNIVLSLGSVGQNVSPAIATDQAVSEVLGDKKTGSVSNSAKSESYVKSSIALSMPKISSTDTQSASNCILSSATAKAPITLAPSVNNNPVILSSLPIGSTFMSVNNNLIPIASPSGAFIPTSLPPNIVLAPVGSSPTLSNSCKLTANSVNIAPSASQKFQSRITAPSSIAITVSSVVREPLYTSSIAKQSSKSVTSSSLPLSSASAQNISRSKYVPITISGSKNSPVKNSNKFSSSSRGTLSLSGIKTYSKLDAYTSEVNPIISLNESSMPDFTTVSVSTPKPSARKRINRSIKPKTDFSNVPSTVNSNQSLTKVIDSRVNSTPISSTPNVTITPQLNSHKPGTLLFESSGDVYMLEPIESEASLPKTVAAVEATKKRNDKSIQTIESSYLTGMRSKYQRKRAAPPTDDSAVMLKVKCYQLEMKYLSSQTECKQLKVELTKERLKNAELTGNTALLCEEDEVQNEKSRANAAEIMKEIEDKYSENKEANVYTMTKTSVLRSLYEDLEELCIENSDLYKELENYRAHDKFYKNLKKRLYDEEF